MATLSWVRAFSTGNQWASAAAKVLITSLPAGDSIVRTHVAWGFGGTTDLRVIPTSVMGNVMGLGLVTTIGNTTEIVPDPLANPNNADPPSRRWLWWSVRAPTLAAYDSAGHTVLWESSLPEEESSSEGQVLAPSGMGVGNTLNLWVSWKPFTGWDASGAAVVRWNVSALVRTP